MSLLLIVPHPRWPAFAILALLWCASMRFGYWWVFQRYTFYGSN
jgi:hypothetical protein